MLHQDNSMKPSVSGRLHPAVTSLLVVGIVVLAVMIIRFAFGDGAIGFLICCPLSCTTPIYAILPWILRKKGNLGTVLPLLAVLLLFIFFIAYLANERDPQKMFTSYLGDPIPAGVTNIQGRYLQEGLETEAVITFQAPPEVIDKIITQNDFKRKEIEDGHIDQDLPEHSWKGNWIGYQREDRKQSGGLAGYDTMWVDPIQSIVVLRCIDSGW
jgi:hypothetical protein